jgi:hypothetical protein
MDGVRLRAQLSETRDETILQIEEGERALAHIRLPATELQNMLQRLAALRAEMREPVERSAEEARTMPTARDPSWSIGFMEADGAAVLALRHPGFGWLAFHLPRERAASLGDALQRAAREGVV